MILKFFFWGRFSSRGKHPSSHAVREGLPMLETGFVGLQQMAILGFGSANIFSLSGMIL